MEPRQRHSDQHNNMGTKKNMKHWENMGLELNPGSFTF